MLVACSIWSCGHGTDQILRGWSSLTELQDTFFHSATHGIILDCNGCVVYLSLQVMSTDSHREAFPDGFY